MYVLPIFVVCNRNMYIILFLSVVSANMLVSRNYEYTNFAHTDATNTWTDDFLSVQWMPAHQLRFSSMVTPSPVVVISGDSRDFIGCALIDDIHICAQFTA